mmetsp:Transcript_16908/g.25077  ORF Transcript_16908/g.25077 Transcript_16908/m.25077 type:complete len:109 (-) Transcript_16908:27-353(-)
MCISCRSALPQVASCLPDCNSTSIADASRFEGCHVEDQCSALEAEELDAQKLTGANADDEACTSTNKPATGEPCPWLDFGSGPSSFLCVIMWFPTRIQNYRQNMPVDV